MKRSFISSVRKAAAALVIAALAAAGLSASPAQAGGVTYAADSAVSERSFNLNTPLTNNKVTIPEHTNSVSFTYNFHLGADFFTDNADKLITASVKVFGPDGAVQDGTNGTAYPSDGTNLSFCDQSYIVCDRSDWNNKSLTVKASHTNGSINVYTSLYNRGDMFSPTLQDLAAGEYTIEVKVLSGGNEVVVDGTLEGVKIQNQNARFWVNVPSYTVGADVQDLSMNLQLCVDSSKIAVGDSLTPTMYINDVDAVVNSMDVWSYTRSQESPNSRQNGFNSGSPVTVTQNDIDYGLAINTNAYRNAPTIGSTLKIDGTITDQDGNDVTGDCAPPAPQKPTMTLQGTTLNVSVSGVKFSQQSECAFYLASDLTTPVKTSYAMAMMPNTPPTCSFSGTTPGETYVVKTRGNYYQIAGAYSEASAPVTIPIPGYTVSPAVSGGDDGGQASVGSNDVASLTGANSVRSTADGQGGMLRLSTFSETVACPPCGPSTSTFTLQKATKTGTVSDFAGTGKVDWAPTGFNATFAIAGWYGSADKWTLLSNTIDPMAFGGQTEILQGTNASAATTSFTVAGSVLNTTCSTAGTGLGIKPSAQSTSISLSPISAPTSKQLYILTCYKPTLMSDAVTTAYLATPVLITIDNATTVNVVKVLGENTAEVNATSVAFSTNPSAGASDAAVTMLVTKKLVTAQTMGMGPVVETGNIVAREIVRLKKDLTSTVTTSGWETGNTAISSEPGLVLPSMNDGSFAALLRSGNAYSIMKVPASGAATASVALTNDKSADMPNASYGFPLGVQSGSLPDITLMAGTATSLAPLSVKVATGAGKAGEIVRYTVASGPGVHSAQVVDSTSKDIYWWFSNTAASAGKLSVYKWRDPLYVKPTGPVPAITSKNLEYATNTPAAGTKVTFTGTNLDLTTAVKFGTVSATIGTKTATSLEVTVPAGSTGTVDVTFESANGNGSGGTFTYVGADKVAQTVSLDAGAATAKVGDADRTLSATVSMTGYTAVASLTYSSTTASVCTVSGTTLKFVAKGTCSVKATQAGSSWTAEGVDTESITVYGPTPTVTTQVTGKATNTPDAGTKVTITGTNLGEVDSVKFGTVTATIGTRSATSLEVTVPAGTKGTVNIVLAYSAGTVTAGSFEYVGATKVAQVVNLNSGSALATVGDADRTLSATVSMTGYTAVASLTYSSTTPAVCTVSGTTLKFVAKGTCSVKATQAASVWAAEGVATASIAVDGPDDQTITVRTVLVGEKQINPDGIFIYGKASSGLEVKLVFNTPSVCKKGTYSDFHVVNLKTGACKITIVQEGNADWAPASKQVTYTVTPAGTKKFVDPGNVGAPVALGSAGSKTNVLSEVVAFKKSTGALSITSKGVWVGPVVATATFKIGAKSYSCTLKYGTLKAVSAKLANTQKTFAASTAFCGGTKAADKAVIAALKKITEPVNVKITVWRDLHNPVKYATRGTQIERAIYVTIG